jgi:hypothetical protein
VPLYLAKWHLQGQTIGDDYSKNTQNGCFLLFQKYKYMIFKVILFCMVGADVAE